MDDKLQKRKKDKEGSVEFVEFADFVSLNSSGDYDFD